MLRPRLTFVGEEHKVWVFDSLLFFKNVFRKVNTSLACYMNIQKYVRSLLIDGLMDVHDLHSYVLLFFCLYSLFTSCLW